MTSGLEPCKAHRYITTWSGERVYLGHLLPEQVRLEDIVASLSNQTRYMGHTEFYCVAEHSIVVARLAQIGGENAFVQKCALGHDFAETYTGDHPSPMKEDVPAIRPFERMLEGITFPAVGLPPIEHLVWKCVKKYDVMALHLEAAQLFYPLPDWVEKVEPRFNMHLECLEPRAARAAFRDAVRTFWGDYEERRPSILAVARSLG